MEEQGMKWTAVQAWTALLLIKQLQANVQAGKLLAPGSWAQAGKHLLALGLSPTQPWL